VTTLGTPIITSQNPEWLNIDKFTVDGKGLEKTQKEDGSWVIKLTKIKNPFTIDPTSKTIEAGESFDIKASNYDGAVLSAAVLSGPASIVGVAGDTIQITGVTAGEAVVQITAADTETYSQNTKICNVTVVPKSEPTPDSTDNGQGSGLSTGDNTLNMMIPSIAICIMALFGAVYIVATKIKKKA
jgi:hypothetical protein